MNDDPAFLLRQILAEQSGGVSSQSVQSLPLHELEELALQRIGRKSRCLGLVFIKRYGATN